MPTICILEINIVTSWWCLLNPEYLCQECCMFMNLWFQNKCGFVGSKLKLIPKCMIILRTIVSIMSLKLDQCHLWCSYYTPIASLYGRRCVVHHFQAKHSKVKVTWVDYLLAFRMQGVWQLSDPRFTCLFFSLTHVGQVNDIFWVVVTCFWDAGLVPLVLKVNCY